MKSWQLTAVCLSVALTSCMANIPEQPPAISDISNADSLVRVQTTWFSQHGRVAFPALHKVIEEGERGCVQFGKPAILLSRRCVRFNEAGACLGREYLFACRTPEGEEIAEKEKVKRGQLTPSTKQEAKKALTQPTAPEPEKGESEVCRRCLREISGRLPNEICDKWCK